LFASRLHLYGSFPLACVRGWPLEKRDTQRCRKAKCHRENREEKLGRNTIPD